MLVNYAMDKIAFDMMGHDLQFEAELQEALGELSEDIFVDEDSTVWWFRKNMLSDLTSPISEYIAYNVTELYQTNEDLRLRNQELSEMIESIEETHRNIVAIAREEEILSMKMHIHSEMGKSVLQIHKYMTKEIGKVSRENIIVDEWQEKAALIFQMRKSLSMLKGEVGQSDEINALEELRMTAKAIGAKIVLEGELSAEKECIRKSYRVEITNTGEFPMDRSWKVED